VMSNPKVKSQLRRMPQEAQTRVSAAVRR